MLLGIAPLMRGELLNLLDQMGHTDRLMLADANFPVIRATCPVVQLGESRMSRVLEDVLTVFPRDELAANSVTRMMLNTDQPERLNSAHEDCLAVLHKTQPGTDFRTPPRELFY